MKAKHLILMLSLALAAGAAVAAINQRHVELSNATPAAKSVPAAIPRVVVTASREQAKAPAQSDESPVARVVVTAPRHSAG